MIKKNGKNLFVRGMLFAFILCTAILSSAVYAQSGDVKTVRVGYYPTANYQATDAYGNRYGFSYDYFVQIQKYTRWKYEFVQASYAECMQMLKNGEIDVMSGITKTPEREEQMLFSRYSTSNSQNKLYASESSENLYYESYDTFDGCKVAIMRGTLHSELDEYCRTHGFSVEIVEYPTPVEMGQALIDGDVDMICASSVSNSIPSKIVAHMEKIPLYYIINKDRPDIKNELDNALRSIIDNNPDFYIQMSKKYMVSGANATATFTREEMDYIKSVKNAYVILNSDWEPISWYDEENGEYKGIFVDVVKEIENYSGMNFEFCTEDEFNNKILPANPEAVNNVIAILADDSGWASAQNVLMSNHVADSSVVMVTKRSSHQDELHENMRIALPKRFYISWCLRNDFPEAKVIYYDTVAQCLDAINEGKADATYVNELVATYFLSTLEYSDLFATANSGYNENLAFAVNKDSEQPLLGILDKSLLCIGNDELNRIVIENSIAAQRVSFRGLYYSNPLLVVSLSCLILLLAGAVVIVIVQMHLRRVRLAKELKRDAETREARTEFFMMISHELRTPLNAVVGYLNLAFEHCSENGLEAEYLKRSRNAARQLSRIAEDMLDYTRIASDTAELREEIFDLKDTIRALCENISLEAEKKELQFKFSVHDLEHEYAFGDRLRVSQIMQNILSNAVKFTDAGGSVKADVYQTNADDTGSVLCFSVTDTGKGMTKEYIQKVCAPFLQNDKAYSRTHGGLGLGLYLTKYYLEAMNGKMLVESELGKGSTFTLQIPLKYASSSEAASYKADFSHLRVIIGGNDEKENARLCDTLKRLGIKCDTATDSVKLKKRLLSRSTTEFAYSLCVIDEDLSDSIDELLSDISQLEKAPYLYVLTDSTKSMDVLAAKTQIRHVLYKPIFQSVLFNAILEDFGVAKQEDMSAATADFGGINAMIVEDNRINSDILMRILKRANVNATLCENGKTAVDTFTESQSGFFKFILMDIQMPVMNGYDATRNIRSSEHPMAKRIPIIAVSANAFPEDIEKSKESGMNEHLSKPINVPQLYSLLQKYLSQDDGKE